MWISDFAYIADLIHKGLCLKGFERQEEEGADAAAIQRPEEYGTEEGSGVRTPYTLRYSGNCLRSVFNGMHGEIRLFSRKVAPPNPECDVNQSDERRYFNERTNYTDKCLSG